MSRAPFFPPPPVAPPPTRAFARMPPAVFPGIMGLFGLGLALRRGVDVIGYPADVPELILGAVSLLWVLAILAYGIKLRQRPAVILQDLAILPGRTGLSAMSLSMLLLAATLLPYSLNAATVLMFAGLALHATIAALIVYVLAKGPEEGRHLTPAWHLHFVGFIIAGLCAGPLGYVLLGQVILIGSAVVAAVIWAVSLVQLARRIPPAPLRPLLAIHLAPASLLGTVAWVQGLPSVALGFALLGGVILAAMVLTLRWITTSGFSALWGAFTFPLAAYTSLLFVLAGPYPVLEWPALVCLIASLGIVPAIAIRILQMWTKGTLAAKTNAATA
jgi:tellurite resistance protein